MFSSATGKTKFEIRDTKHYVPIATLLTQDNSKVLEQLKSVFIRTINCNICQSKISMQIQKQYLYFLTDPSFQGVNKLFVLLFNFQT